MCGRFVGGNLTQAQMLEIIDGFLSGAAMLDAMAPPPATGYNIKPTNQVPLVFRHQDAVTLSTARWWFVPAWHKGDASGWKATTFNAKLETAAEKPTFRNAWTRGRCLIPAQGYFEWTGAKGAKQPWYVTVETNAPVLFFAGLYATDRQNNHSCAILTRAAAPQLRHLHPRMPVILLGSEVEAWLAGLDPDGTVVAQYGTACDGRFVLHRVRRFGLRDDGPDLIEPL